MRNIKPVKYKICINKHIPNKVSFFIWCIIYRIFIDIGYSRIIGPHFRYVGFIVDPTLGLVLYSWIVFLLFADLTYKSYQNRNRLSDEIIFVLFLLSVVPTTTMTAFGQYPAGFIIYYTVYWTVIFFIHHLFVLGNLHFCPKRRENVYFEYMLMAVFVLIAFVIIYISAKYTNFRIHFNLLTVYGLREEASKYSLSTILRYLYGWSRVTMPIFIVYFFLRNRRGLAWVCFGIQMLNFGIEGSKTVFFMAIFAIIISHLPQINITFLNGLILKGITCWYALCILFYQLTGSIVPASMLMRRVLFVPAYLQWAYYDYFLDKTPDYFRRSFLRHFGFKTPYPDLDNIIGGLYSYSSATNANNGLISDAITNLGYFGVIIMPIILCLVLCALDDSSRGLDSRIYILVSLYLTISLTNTFLNTVLLTHGLLIIIFIMLFMKRKTGIRYLKA